MKRTITVGKPADELYEMWRDPEQLTQVMGHCADVSAVDGDRLHWSVRGPFGRDLEWETRFTGRRSVEFLRWESLEDAAVPNEGSVRFAPAPGDRGTEVTLHLRFDPPGGRLGNAALECAGFVPAALAKKALHRFKSLAETGEIPTLEGNPSARGRGDAPRQAIRACRKGGTLSILGVYGVMDKFPLGVVMNKGLTVRTAQQHGQRYVPQLLEHVEEGEMNPSYLATHEFSLEDSPRGYEMFKEKTDGCVRPVFTP